MCSALSAEKSASVIVIPRGCSGLAFFCAPSLPIFPTQAHHSRWLIGEARLWVTLARKRLLSPAALAAAFHGTVGVADFFNACGWLPGGSVPLIFDSCLSGTPIGSKPDPAAITIQSIPNWQLSFVFCHRRMICARPRLRAQWSKRMKKYG